MHHSCFNLHMLSSLYYFVDLILRSQALHLMDIARRSGGRLPPPGQVQPPHPTSVLPQASVPISAPAPAAHAPWSLQTQFGDRSATAQQAAAAQGPPVLPVFPQRFDYQEEENTASAAIPSKVPVTTAAVAATLAESERQGPRKTVISEGYNEILTF